MTPLEVYLAQVAGRAERATQGPWTPEDHDWGSNNGVIVADPNADGVCTVHNHGTRSWTRFVAVPAHDHACELGSESHRNMQFIAASRTDVPKLLAIIAEMRGAIEGGTERGGVFWREIALQRADEIAGKE